MSTATRRPEPNFFLIGAPRSGTTALARYLSQHPSVFMSPIKEPCFFAPEVTTFEPRARETYERDRGSLRAYLDGPMCEPRDHGHVLGWDDYLMLFRRVCAETAIGEASVAYLSSLNAPGAIPARLPDARLLMVLRDPADRLWSQYTAARIAGATAAAFTDWIDQQLAVESERTPPIGSVWSGYYGRHIERYRRTVPSNRMHVIFYEDYVRDPGAVLRGVFAFLNVDPTWPCDVSRRHNVTRESRWPSLRRFSAVVPSGVRARVPRGWIERPVRAVSTPEERARAIAIYADDIRTLSTLLERDLSRWLDPVSL